MSYLDSSDIGILRNIFVLVQSILRGLSLAQINTELNEKQHHGLERGDRAAARSLGGDMLVKDIKGGGSLAHGDEFLSPLNAKILAKPFVVDDEPSAVLTLRTFSGLI